MALLWEACAASPWALRVYPKSSCLGPGSWADGTCTPSTCHRAAYVLWPESRVDLTPARWDLPGLGSPWQGEGCREDTASCPVAIPSDSLLEGAVLLLPTGQE